MYSKKLRNGAYLIAGLVFVGLLNQARGFMSSNTAYLSESNGSFVEWIKMRVKEGSIPVVEQTELAGVLTQVDTALIASNAALPRATWVGHATMLVQYKGVNFLTDPHLTNFAGPLDHFGPERLTPPAILFEQMPQIDFIVISHNHYDHLDHQTVELFGNSVQWYVPMGLKKWFIERGIDEEKVVELDWWQSHKFSEAVMLTLTPSKHWSKRSAWDTNQSHWGSWSVNVNGFNTWFAGDTAYDAKMFKEIGRRTGPYDLAMIPIGAYAPRYFMGNQHIDPAEAVQIHLDLKAKQSIPVHWATFQLTHEPFLEPPYLLEQEMEKAGLPLSQFKVVMIGETRVFEAVGGL